MNDAHARAGQASAVNGVYATQASGRRAFLRGSWFAVCFVCACSESVPVGYDLAAAGSGGAGTGGASNASNGGVAALGGSDQGGASDGGDASCERRECSGKIYDCGDCEDNDADGLIDALDPECLGVCDDTEDAYFGGIPGQNNAPCRQDCYFDNDSGGGNDNCSWTHACDPLSVAPDYPPGGTVQCAYDAGTQTQGQSCAELRASQDEQCLTTCLPLAPNGCDCFGCCELPARSGNFVSLGSQRANEGSCFASSVDDPLACRPCTPVLACFNACEPCERCAGGAAPTASCSGGTACAVGVRACRSTAECESDAYCVTGCCVDVPR